MAIDLGNVSSIVYKLTLGLTQCRHGTVDMISKHRETLIAVGIAALVVANVSALQLILV